MSDFTGRWLTTFGPMDLVQQGKRVDGTYGDADEENALEGKVNGSRLTFSFQEPNEAGEGWFELKRDGQAFHGEYCPEGSAEWSPWQGVRFGFDGLWQTDYGLLRLIDEGELVRGFYEPSGTLQGSRSGHELAFTFEDPHSRGRGQFTLAEDGLGFSGQWQPETSGDWIAWSGERVRPEAGRAWLVVIEAPWQRSLVEREYSYGGMVGEFFARCADVEVRHRLFANEESLSQYCREVMYLAEPVYVLLATHALPDGITVGGKIIAVPPLLEHLRHVPELRLLHFSACLLMKDPAMRRTLQSFSDQSGVPVSGYTTAVDWVASAILEFAYLELILSHGYSVVEAAEQVMQLLPFAGEKGGNGDAFVPVGFRMVRPSE